MRTSATGILNTPGYFYAVSYMLSCLVILLTNKRRIKTWKAIILHGGIFAFLLGFMILTDGVRVSLFIPSMCMIIGLIWADLYLGCEFNVLQASYYCVKAFINGEFAASLCWQVYYHFSRQITWMHAWLWKAAEILLVYALIYGCIFLLERRLHKDTEDFSVTKRELLIVCLIAVAIFAVSNISYLDQNSLFSASMASDIFVIRTLVDFSGLAVLYAYHFQKNEMQMRFEKDTLHNIMDMQYKNYQLSQESIDLVNQKYHDLKHQIAILRAEADTEKNLGYLEKMEREIRIYEAQNKTGNKVLDAVLTTKSAYCQNKDIELKIMADGALLDFMEDMDVSALFGNMLDNAIESAQKQKAGKRLVGLYISGEKSFLRIRIQNYCEEKVRFRNGIPLTTKKDKRYHGYGMKSMLTTVEKYGGSAVASQEDNWFELKILIPLGTQVAQ